MKKHQRILMYRTKNGVVVRNPHFKLARQLLRGRRTMAPR
jgi:hypothetical protein